MDETEDSEPKGSGEPMLAEDDRVFAADGISLKPDSWIYSRTIGDKG